MSERNAFSIYLSKLLIKYKITLRELSRRSGIDVGNLSKIERGIAYPPQKRATLEKLASSIPIDEKEKTQLFDLAALVNGKLPQEVYSLRSNIAIPLLLRAVNNKVLSQEETLRLAKLIEESEEWKGKVVE